MYSTHCLQTLSPLEQALLSKKRLSHFHISKQTTYIPLTLGEIANNRFFYTMEDSPLPLPPDLIEAMRRTEQNPRYHAEGNVLNHTHMVLGAYRTHAPEFTLDDDDHEVLYWAAVLHDIGKPIVTRWRGHRWSAKGHERAGVAPARDLLLQQPNISASQRQRILDLVRYHAIPLQWGLHQRPISDYKRMATRTDVRLMGIFAYFDILGRICERKSEVLALIRRFNQQIVPQIHYEVGSFSEVQQRYQQASHQHKNALWHSLNHDMRLTEKLLQVHGARNEKPIFTCVIPIGVAPNHRPEVDQQGFGHFKYYDAGALHLDFSDPHAREGQLRQLKHFVSVYGRDQQHLVIDGLPTDPKIRAYVANYCRQQGAHIEYLFVERRLDSLLTSAPNAGEAERLRHAHAHLDAPHPWEAHRVTVMG